MAEPRKCNLLDLRLLVTTNSSEEGQDMPEAKEPERQWGVLDLMPLVAQTIRDRLRQIEQAEAQSKIPNRCAARERMELLRLALEAYQACLGMPVRRR